MIDVLNTLYREVSQRAGLTPCQSHALAEAAYVLGSGGVPSGMVREALTLLRAASEKSPEAVR